MGRGSYGPELPFINVVDPQKMDAAGWLLWFQQVILLLPSGPLPVKLLHEDFSNTSDAPDLPIAYVQFALLDPCTLARTTLGADCAKVELTFFLCAVVASDSCDHKRSE